MADLAEDLRFRGLIHQITDPSLEHRLDSDRLTAYTGFDPTADSLHVGHLLQMCNLRRLQLAGHRPIAVAGGGTGFVGDPGGKSEERTLLSRGAARANLAGIQRQLERFIEFDSGRRRVGRALLVNNADWLGDLSLFEFLRDVGKHFTVNQMVAKDSVKSRLSRADQGISYTEFSYMLLQAYDFLHLFDAFGCRLQLGGSDQWGNITMGIELVRKVRQEEVWGLTTPLVLKADGTKFGKTESGTVWLDRRPDQPLPALPVLLPHARTRWSGPTCDTSRSSPTRRSSNWIGPPPTTPRSAGPSGPWPARCARWCTVTARRRGPNRPPPPCSGARWPSSTSGPSSTCSPMPPRPPCPAASSTDPGSPWSTCWSTPGCSTPGVRPGPPSARVGPT